MGKRLNLYVLCATGRGLAFLEKLFELCPHANYYVFSFKETAWEPKYIQDIKDLTEAHGACFFETTNIAKPEFNNLLADHPPDVMFCVSWRYLLPMAIADKSRIASIVFHDSLLPAYRGFSPTVWAIINGENQTGVTMFHLAREVDSGDIIDQTAVPIGPDDNIEQVMKAVTENYLQLLEKNLSSIINGCACRTPQDHGLATYTCKRVPEDNEIDWSSSTHSIYDLIRAVRYPYTGAYTWHKGRRLIIWSASLPEKQYKYSGCIPGTVIEIVKEKGVIVLTRDGQLMLETVQYEEEEKTSAANLLNSLSIRLGKS